MGKSPYLRKQYSPAVATARLIRGLDEDFVNAKIKESMANGLEKEADVRAILSDQGQKFEPMTVINDGYLASLDGAIVEDGRISKILEVKAPTSETSPTLTHLDAGEIWDLHFYQIQHQLMVTEAECATLIIVDPRDGEWKEFGIEPNPQIHSEIKQAWEEMWWLLECDEEDMTDCVPISPDQRPILENYKRALDHFSQAKDDFSHAEKQVMEAIQSGEIPINSEGFHLRIVEKEGRKGSTSWKRLATVELKKLNVNVADLEAEYKNPDSESKIKIEDLRK